MSFTPTPFARDLTAHLCRWRRTQDGSGSPMFAHWLDGIHPSIRGQAAALSLKLHSHAAAVSSSQVFALNLFLGWPEGSPELSGLVSTTIGVPFTFHRADVEWVPPGDWLGEIAGDVPGPNEPATAVDVVLWGEVAREPAAVLVEVKLGEGGFTACNGRTSAGNRTPEVCADGARFLRDPQACYLTHPYRATRDRRYWDILTRAYGSVAAALPGFSGGGCPFAFDHQQPMRNLAIARALEQEGRVVRAWYALCAHDHNPDVALHWAAWQALRGASEPTVPASKVLAAGSIRRQRWSEELLARYGLDR